MVGVDLMDIRRVKLALLRTPRFKWRVFTPKEIEWCESRKNPYPSYAARFAAKEAFRKLHPCLAKAKFHEVEVVNGPEGRPELNLTGRAFYEARKLDIKHIAVSISHAGDYALACVVAEKEARG